MAPSTWFVDRGVIHHEGADAARREAAVRSARAAGATSSASGPSARRCARSPTPIVEHRAAREATRSTTVNRALHARQVIELVAAPTASTSTTAMSATRSTTPSRAWPSRSSRELTGGHPDRIRVCDSDTCRWVFYDTSRTGRRRWCDMATCGNRAKAARHRAEDVPLEDLRPGDAPSRPRSRTGRTSVARRVIDSSS